MKVLWGMDPFHQNEKKTKKMARLIGPFLSQEKDLVVGYIANRDETNLTTAFDIPAEQRFTTYPKKLLLEKLKYLGFSIGDKNVQVIPEMSISTTRSVDAFLELGKKVQADILALFTHGKKGLGRFFLGSFAETAIHRSPIDLIIVNPKSQVKAEIKRILYCSDFSSASKRDLRRVLKICEQTKSAITVFHAAEILYRWSLNDENPEVVAYRKKVAAMEKWIKAACEASGISNEVIIKAEYKTVGELALQSARKAKAGLILVTAETGRFAALMGGSVTREIIRTSLLPVYVMKR